MLEWLEEEYRALSRENELCADGDAAEQVGRDEMARALVLLEAGSARLAEVVFAALEQELIGAINAPMPPFRRIFDRLEDIRAPGALAAAAVVGLKREEDPKSTHPPLGKRLANLGFTDIPPIEEVQTSAIDQVLTRDAARELTERFDDEWRKMANGWLRVGR